VGQRHIHAAVRQSQQRDIHAAVRQSQQRDIHAAVRQSQQRDIHAAVRHSQLIPHSLGLEHDARGNPSGLDVCHRVVD
jgi:head-tail adaptor